MKCKYIGLASQILQILHPVIILVIPCVKLYALKAYLRRAAVIMTLTYCWDHL